MARLGTFRFKLMATLLVLVGVVVAPMALSWTGLQRSIHYAERSHAAHEVLDAHLLLAERGQRLLRHFRTADPATPDPAEDVRLRRQLDEEFARARATIAAEAVVAGPAGLAVETRELRRLQEIRSRLDQALAGADDTGWRALIALTVADEQAAADAVDAANRRINGAVRLGLAISSILALLVGAGALLLLQRALQRPLWRLTKGTRALAGGDLAHRIAMPGEDEFAALGRDFDRMAENIEAQARTIAEARDELEDKVRERTADLAAANARLEDIAERRQRFLADISHELRTPLTIVRGEAEVTLRATPADPGDYRAALARIADQARAMARLVDDLLFVARTESGAPRLRPEPVRLRDMLETCAGSIRPLIAADGGDIRLVADANGGGPTIGGDPGRLRQLVHILIDNAIRYSTEPPEIEITLLPSPGGWTFRIADRGIGIMASEIGHIFERYRRGGAASARDEEGLGLGLPMAKAIVEAHGGSIRVESDEGLGTTVAVFLPSSPGLKAAA